MNLSEQIARRRTFAIISHHGAPSAIERSEEREHRTPVYHTQCVLPLASLSDTGTLVHVQSGGSQRMAGMRTRGSK